MIKDSVALHQLMSSLVAGIVSFLFFFYIDRQAMPWVVIVSLLMVQIRVGLVTQTMLTQLFSGVMVILLMVVIHLMKNAMVMLSLLLAFTSAMSVLVGARNRSLFYPAFCVNLFILMMAGNGFYYPYQTAIGTIIASLATLLCWPLAMRFQFKQLKRRCLRGLETVLDTVFAIYLFRDYREEQVNYEKELFELSHHFYEDKKTLFQLNPKSPVHRHFERVYEIIMSLGLMRHRIKDVSTFELIDREMRIIYSQIKDQFNRHYQHQALSSQTLLASIDLLDETYRKVLQVVSKEPLVFLFFLENLRKLSRELSKRF